MNSQDAKFLSEIVIRDKIIESLLEKMGTISEVSGCPSAKKIHETSVEMVDFLIKEKNND